MEIDIVDLESEKYSNLSPVQLAMVRAAQARKNKIMRDADEEKYRVKTMMLANRTARSTILRDELSYIDEQAADDVEAVISDLDYQLAYEALGSEGNDEGPYRYPENPNYNLSYSQRFLVVRQYYMDVTDDPQARVEAFNMDTLAQSYLGEFYMTLHDLLLSYV